jgi:hypothetical protein
MHHRVMLGKASGGRMVGQVFYNQRLTSMEKKAQQTKPGGQGADMGMLAHVQTGSDKAREMAMAVVYPQSSEFGINQGTGSLGNLLQNLFQG